MARESSLAKKEGEEQKGKVVKLKKNDRNGREKGKVALSGNG